MNVDPASKWPSPDVVPEPDDELWDPPPWRTAALVAFGALCVGGGTALAFVATQLAMGIAGMRPGSFAYLLILGSSVIIGALVGLMAMVPLWAFGEERLRRRALRRIEAAQQKRLRDLLEGPRR